MVPVNALRKSYENIPKKSTLNNIFFSKFNYNVGINFRNQINSF